jgi:hypothetical protein
MTVLYGRCLQDWETSTAPYRKNVAHLNMPENELYDHLATHANATGCGLLLEQERIPWTHANGILIAAAELPG